MNTQIQNIFNQSSKLYQWVTTKQKISLVYYSFLAWVVIGIIFLCLGLALDVSTLTSTILIAISAFLLIFGLIVFYVFEFIRRKALHYFQKQFDFKSLFNDELLKDQILSSSMMIDTEFDSTFYKLHAEFAKNTNESAAVSNNYATYILYTKMGIVYFSHCNINVINHHKSEQKMQFILMIKSNISHTPKNNYQYKQINDQHYYGSSCPAEETVMFLNGIKFYKHDWKYITAMYTANLILVEDLIKSIQSQK